MTYSFDTKGSCSKRIHIETEGELIRSVRFENGCSGNTQGLSALLPGMRIDDAIAKLEGIECRNGTSCPDQLSKALKTMKSMEA